MAWLSPEQAFPSAGYATIAYIAPDDKQTTISTIHVCNQSAYDATFRIAVVNENEELDLSGGKQYLYWNEKIRAERGFTITTGITIKERSSLYVQSSNGRVSFNISGVEQ